MASKAMTLATVFTAIDKMTGPVRKMTGGMVSFDKVVKSLNRSINIAAGIAGAGLLYLGKRGLDLASDLTEVQNVVDTSFGAAGAQTVNRWAEAAIKGFGLSELQAKKFTGTMGAMLKSSGLTGDSLAEMSTTLAGLAGDFASFYNLDAEEAFMKIRSGLSGEVEPLRQLGINMSVANLEAFALARGIKKPWASMKQAEQIQLRYAYLMQVSADAQGDFAKTLETSYANQRRVLATNFEQTIARAMKSVLPVAIDVSKRLNDVVNRVGAWVDANQGLIGQKVEKVINAIGVALEFVTSPDVLKSIASLIVAVKALGVATMIFGAGNPMVATIGAIAGLITLIVANWDKITGFFDRLAGGQTGHNAPGRESTKYGDASTGYESLAPAVSSSTSVSRSELAVSFANPPAGMSARQTGSAPGITVDLGRTMGGGSR